MKKQDILEEIAKIKEVVGDYNKIGHLFSEDEGKKSFAKLNQALGSLRLLLEANDIKELAHPNNRAINEPLFGKAGVLVSVRPCGEEYGNKTYLGFLIGEVALGSSITLEADKIQLNFSGHNPAIFVPELKKIIYGCESWWSEIESEDDFKKITDGDIENVWYVKLWKQIQESEQSVVK